MAPSSAMAAERAGVGRDEPAEIIGDHSASNLWGCAFEDLVSSGPDEGNVAADDLKHHSWKESAATRASIEALRRSTMSLDDVSDTLLARASWPETRFAAKSSCVCSSVPPPAA